MNKLRVGIIGTGMAFERLHYPAFEELSDYYDITAICNSTPEKLQYWAQYLQLDDKNVYTDYKKMFQDKNIDLVDIMVPIEENYPITEEAAKAGIPIICEKPLAADREQAKAHRDLAKKFNVPIMIAENYRYSEETSIIKSLIDQKKLGEPVFFIHTKVTDFPQERWENQFPAKEWRQHPKYQGGAILDMAVHNLSALRHIFGSVDKVHGLGKKQNADWSPYSVINVNILFKSGMPGQFTFYCGGPEVQRPLIGLRIFCTRGTIYLEENTCGVINLFYNDESQEQIPFRTQRGFYNELLNFYRAAQGQEEITVTPEIEYGDAKMVFDILESIETGNPVQIDQDPVLSRL
ncbi:Gfo/Idh/MocA family oxidoreductase [Candidatus Contubernalis alkalaceticus]|nr:Gfo/Idh/MocA family oxidoreductase [Candidatus Contubernalis alkalaceticus]